MGSIVKSIGKAIGKRFFPTSLELAKSSPDKTNQPSG